MTIVNTNERGARTSNIDAPVSDVQIRSNVCYNNIPEYRIIIYTCVMFFCKELIFEVDTVLDC